MSSQELELGATVCNKCGKTDNIYSSIHPLSPTMFSTACKCNHTCKCGGYIDDYGKFLGPQRAYMACNCALKSKRIAERPQRYWITSGGTDAPKVKKEIVNPPLSYRPPWQAYLLNPDMWS